MGINEVPEGLHAREYAMHILHSLGMPNEQGRNPNLLLIAECIIALTKCDRFDPRLTLTQAHRYLERAIRLAHEQYVPVDYFFFRNAVYMQMRPVQKLPEYKARTKEFWEETRRQQASPEFEAMVKQMDTMFKSWSTGSKMK